MWFIGVEVEQETSALPPKKNPGSASVLGHFASTDDMTTKLKWLTFQHQENSCISSSPF